jgi:hypothetical protein
VSERQTCSCHARMAGECMCGAWDDAAERRVYELRADRDRLRAQVDTMIRLHDEVEADRDRLAVRVGELESECIKYDDANRDLHAELRRFKTHTCYGPLIAPELMESCETCRANRAEHERDELAARCSSMAAVYEAARVWRAAKCERLSGCEGGEHDWMCPEDAAMRHLATAIDDAALNPTPTP